MFVVIGRWAAVALVVVLVAACSQSAQAVPTPTAPPHGWTMVAEIKVGRTPGPIVLGGSWAFVANMSDGTVTQMERSTGKVVATINVANPAVLRSQGCAPDSVHAYYSGSWGWRYCDTPYAIAWDGAMLWALDNGNRWLVPIDPVKHVATGRIQLPGTGWSVAIASGVAYVSGFADNQALYVADLRSRAVTTVNELDAGPAMLAADASGVWVACARAGTGHLDRIDPATGRVTGRFPMDWWSTAVALGQGSVYVRGTFGGDITRYDPASGAIDWSQPGPGFIGRQGIDQMAAASNGVWMAGPSTALVDQATGTISQSIKVPSESVAAGSGEVWIVELNGSVAKFQLK
jgi:DNA-binding beta-propeller fold protein YncE